jgi:cytochrome c-type biogenesis protein CcmH
MIWILFVILTAGALAALVVPLLRGRAAAAQRLGHDLAVYREQLKELEADVARGTIASNDAAAARVEIERRILRAGSEIEGAASARPQRAAAIATAILVPAFAAFLYARLGSPAIPDQPLAQRNLPALQQHAAGGGNQEIANLVEKLAARLQNDPNDRAGWVLLGRSFVMLERHNEAVAAYGRAVAMDPKDAEAQMAHGEAQVYAGGGVVTPGALTAFENALKIDPRHPGGRYYVALGRAQGGDFRAAFDLWRALEADSPPDAPWLAAVRQRIAEAAGELKIAVPPPVAGAAPAPTRGPTPEQMAAAASLPEGDRMQMIQGMVQGLADRLRQSPDDYEGWMRLGRAYVVLKNEAGAKDAYAKAAALRPNEPEPHQALAALGAAPQHAPPKAEPPRGPTPEQIQDAAKLDPTDRQAMIRTMVESLSERLKANPNDVEGWVRLGRSYRVMGDLEKSREAFGRAATLRPADIDLLSFHAASIVAADGGETQPLTPSAKDAWQKVLELAPNQPDALWFTGKADAEAGRRDEAARKWQRLLSQLDPKSDAWAEVKRGLDTLGR